MVINFLLSLLCLQMVYGECITTSLVFGIYFVHVLLLQERITTILLLVFTLD